MRLTDYLLIAAIAVIIYLLFFRPQPVHPPNTERERQLRDSVRIYQDSVKIFSAQSEAAQKIVDSVKEASAISAQKYRTFERQARAREAELRFTVQTLIDTIPELKTYVAYRDSVDTVKSRRIIQLEHEIGAAFKSHEGLVSSKDAEIRGRDRIINHQEGIIQEKENANQKLKKKVTVRTILIGVGTAVGVAVTWVVMSLN